MTDPIEPGSGPMHLFKTLVLAVEHFHRLLLATDLATLPPDAPATAIGRDGSLGFGIAALSSNNLLNRTVRSDRHK